MSTFTDQLYRQHETMTEAARTACDASQSFARAANGNNGHIIAAPTAYDILGNLKVLLRNLQEVTDHLPRGLTASLEDTRLVITDRDYMTGEQRDPAHQVALAREYLTALSTALEADADHAEGAQSTLNSQGYDETP